VRSCRVPNSSIWLELSAGVALKYEFPGDDLPVIKGSAPKRCSEEFTREDAAHKPLWELMDAVDAYIPTPERENDKPFF